MSKQEFSRLEVLLRVQSGGLRIADACELIGLHRRQVFRLLGGLKQDGVASLLSKRRGKPSNHRLPTEVRTLALSIVRDRYADFGPTLAAEKLAEHHTRHQAAPNNTATVGFEPVPTRPKCATPLIEVPLPATGCPRRLKWGASDEGTRKREEICPRSKISPSRSHS